MKYSTISIIIPVFNEEKTVNDIIKQVIKVRLPVKKEIVLVDDGSTDGSRAILKRYSKKEGFKVILKDKNEGKGSAVIAGLSKASGDVLLIQDADLEYDPKEYPILLKPILTGKSEVVYGTRFKSKEGHLKSNRFIYNLHCLGNSLLTAFTNLLYGVKLTDMETCYKVFTRNVYKHLTLRSKRFEFEPEITSKILKAGFSIHEVPITYFSRDFNEGKKITFVDGIKAFYYLLKFRLSDS